jgi:hypothetical protein
VNNESSAIRFFNTACDSFGQLEKLLIEKIISLEVF